MKKTNRFAIVAVSAITALAPLAMTSTASAAPRHNGHQYEQRRDVRPPARPQARWDARQHNGYYYQGQWRFGAPPAAHAGRPGFQPGYRAWKRGDRVPAYYRDRAHQVDYRRHNLRAPPRGYTYVRDDRGAILLVGIATGVVLSAILAR